MTAPVKSAESEGRDTAIGGRRYARVRGLTFAYWRSLPVARRDISAASKAIAAAHTCHETAES